MQGSLSAAYGLADAVKGVYVGRRSGILAVERDEVRKRLYFDSGSFTFSDTNEKDWRLGQLCVRLGKMEQRDLDHVLSLLSPDKRIGRVMTELGLLSPDDLNEVVQYQITENVYPIFAWTQGEFDFEEKDEAVPSDIAFPYSSANLIMEGVRRIDDPELIRGAVGGLDQIVSLGDNPLLRFQSIFLQPKEGFILSRIDGALSIEEVCAISPVPEEEVLTCLYGLKSTGILEFRSSGEEVAAEVEQEGNIAGFFNDFAGVERFLGENTVTAAAAAAAEQRREMDEIVEFAQRLRTLDHYGVLGVETTAEAGEIRKAYYKLAKKYHPDRHHKSREGDVHAQVERIFVRVNEAYETLKDTGQREVYDRKLAAGSAPDGGESPAVVMTTEQQEARKKQMATDAFADGKRKLDANDLFGAIRSFRLAIHNQPDVGRYRSYLGRSLAQNPKWRKEAEEHLLEAIRLEPNSGEHYAELGELYRRAGLGSKAERYYAEALKRDPTNAVARDGRDELTQDRKASSSLGGTFRSLFDRKK